MLMLMLINPPLPAGTVGASAHESYFWLVGGCRQLTAAAIDAPGSCAGSRRRRRRVLPPASSAARAAAGERVAALVYNV